MDAGGKEGEATKIVLCPSIPVFFSIIACLSQGWKKKHVAIESENKE